MHYILPFIALYLVMQIHKSHVMKELTKDRRFKDVKVNQDRRFHASTNYSHRYTSDLK